MIIQFKLLDLAKQKKSETNISVMLFSILSITWPRKTSAFSVQFVLLPKPVTFPIIHLFSPEVKFFFPQTKTLPSIDAHVFPPLSRNKK